MRPSQAQIRHEEEPRLRDQASTWSWTPHSFFLTRAPSPSQNLASHFKASEDSTQTLSRKKEQKFSPLTPPGPVYPCLLPSVKWLTVGYC